jgi:membrane protein DedA with SNARE-associated domain
MEFLASAYAFFHASKYALLFIGCYIEGTVVMLGAGILWHAGAVEFWPAYFALLSADILADLMWYAIGYFGARRSIERWGPRFGLTHDNIERVERRFHKYHTQILLVSKLSMGFGLAVATLTTAGMLRVPLFRFFMINLVGGIVWVYAVMIVGYYFGNVLTLIPKQFQIAFALLVLALVFWGLKVLSKKLASSDW